MTKSLSILAVQAALHFCISRSTTEQFKEVGSVRLADALQAILKVKSLKKSDAYIQVFEKEISNMRALEKREIETDIRTL